MDDCGDLGVGEVLLVIDERGEGGRGTLAVDAVAGGALALVDACAGGVAVGLVRVKSAGPGEVVGVDVDDAGAGVDSGASPLRAAIEAGKDDGLAVGAERNKLALAAVGAKLALGPGMGFGGARGEHVLGEALAGEGRGERRYGLGGRGLFAGNIGLGEGGFVDGEERLAGGAIEEVEEALLGGLCDRVDVLVAGADGDERGGRGAIAVPDVVVNALEVPETFAGVGVEGKERVGEAIVAEAIGAVEVIDGGACRDVDDAADLIERHPGPVVGGAGVLPGALGPGIVTFLAGAGDGVEDPAEFPGVDVVGADVST